MYEEHVTFQVQIVEEVEEQASRFLEQRRTVNYDLFVGSVSNSDTTAGNVVMLYPRVRCEILKNRVEDSNTVTMV